MSGSCTYEANGTFRIQSVAVRPFFFLHNICQPKMPSKLSRLVFCTAKKKKKKIQNLLRGNT